MWGYDTSIEPLRALNTCGIRWSPESAQTVHHPVVPWILRMPTTIEIWIISSVFLKTLFGCHHKGTYAYLLVGD